MNAGINLQVFVKVKYRRANGARKKHVDYIQLTFRISVTRRFFSDSLARTFSVLIHGPWISRRRGLGKLRRCCLLCRRWAKTTALPERDYRKEIFEWKKMCNYN